MGVATAISLGLAAVGTGASIVQGIKAADAQAKADEAAVAAANDLARIQENDKFLSLNVPTLGLEKATQNMQAWQQSQIQALKDTGAAGVLGGLTAARRQADEQDLALAAQADDMQYKRNMALAQNAQQIEQGRVQRQANLAQQRLEGAQRSSGQSAAAFDAAVQGGIGNLANAAFTAQYFGGQPKDVSVDQTPVNKNNYSTIWDAQKAGNQNPVTNAATIGAAMNASQGAFAPKIAAMPAQNATNQAVSYPGMYNVNTGDPLNDMYNRNASLGNLWMYTNPRF